jgi:ElaB/YqjD/DUF883 family membrane-anchored ribosome-binding protein
MKTTLNPDDFNFLLATLNETIKEITEKKEAKQETMYNRIETELREVQQSLQSIRVAPTTPLLEGTIEEGDEFVQLCKIADIVEVLLRSAEEVTTQVTQALQKAQEEIIE